MQIESVPAVSAILVTAHRLTRLAAQLSGTNTSPAVWRTLSILRTGGPLRIGALASASRVSQPTMTKLLGGLLDDGFVSRIADADDSRASVIAVTPAGEEALDAHISRIDSTLAPLFADLSSAEKETLEAASRILQSRAESTLAASMTPSDFERKEEFA